MERVDLHLAGSLRLDDFAKIQRTLADRAGARDRANIIAIGFGLKVRGGERTNTISARFVVRRKREQVPDRKRIPLAESVRLLDHRTKTYRLLRIATDVVQHGPPKPVGVTTRAGKTRATAAAVVRWTMESPVPARPRPLEPTAQSRWRWGIITVAHAIGGVSTVTIGRVVTCLAPPQEIAGTVVARGRLPGGPDVALVETGFDRLWLSGFLPRPDADFLPSATAEDVLRWIRDGGTGYLHTTGAVGRWQFEIYFPERTVSSLGRLRHVIQFAWSSEDSKNQPLGPGTSGAILVDGGVPAGMQIAGLPPEFDRGYAQLMLATLPWIRQQIGATAIGIMHVF